MNTHNNCLACEIAANPDTAPGGLIHEGKFWNVCHSARPALMRGSLFIFPKRHCENIYDLTMEEAAEYGIVLQKTGAAMRDAFAPERIYVCSFGEVMRHVHFHIIPRMPTMSAAGPEVIQAIFEKRIFVCSDEEAAAAAKAVRERFNRKIS